MARIFAFVLLFTTSFGTWGLSAKQKREADYQAAVQSYSDALKPGATRKSVEDYLQAKGVKYEKMCCIDEKNADAELVRIGKEKHPWYCSEHDVYIAFQFVDDKLKSITVYHWLEGCL
jgi:hypothetical protein